MIGKRTIPDASQFATLTCNGNLLNKDDDTRFLRLLVPSLKAVDLRFGLSAATIAAVNRSTLNHLDDAHTVIQTLTTSDGQTLVAWARTAGYDPRGPRSLGVQIYRADGTFDRWLKDSGFERPAVLCGRYLVGGDNTLRVWDTAADFKLLTRKTFAQGGSGELRELQCSGNMLTVTPALRLNLPALTPGR